MRRGRDCGVERRMDVLKEDKMKVLGKKRLITCEVHPLPRYGMVISVYYYPGTLWLSWISAVVTGP